MAPNPRRPPLTGGCAINVSTPRVGPAPRRQRPIDGDTKEGTSRLPHACGRGMCPVFPLGGRARRVARIDKRDFAGPTEVTIAAESHACRGQARVGDATTRKQTTRVPIPCILTPCHQACRYIGEGLGRYAVGLDFYGRNPTEESDSVYRTGRWVQEYTVLDASRGVALLARALTDLPACRTIGINDNTRPWGTGALACEADCVPDRPSDGQMALNHAAQYCWMHFAEEENGYL
ncbi:hypothetical protein LX36DRAFT_336043 [Colletotrichum falcatum]|nr:hypothetical protein LX36DRAFT_336043 [Colletotrichum falcatum]